MVLKFGEIERNHAGLISSGLLSTSSSAVEVVVGLEGFLSITPWQLVIPILDNWARD